MGSARVERVGIVGAGNMGSGIAQKIATEGWPVIMVDTAAGIDRAKDLLETSISEGVERRIYSPEAAQALRDRITTTTDYAALADVDLVIEAVFEEESVKRAVFEQLDAHCRADTILATNTSSLSVSRLAHMVSHPERVLGLHFFYHPAKNRLVEVVPGERTDPDLLAKAWRFVEAVGKTPIHCLDRPGFVVNRFFVPWLNESCRLLEEGLSIASIEAGAKRGLGTALGPFELMNMTGIPIALHAQGTLHRELGDFYLPSERLREQVESGDQWPLDGPVDDGQAAQAQSRMNAVVFQIALSLIDEGVGTKEDTDIGARVGLRWPAGPIERMNQLGLENVQSDLLALGQLYGCEVPRCFSDALESGQFTLKQIASETEDGVTTITINRPDALNALSPVLVAEFAAAFDAAAADPATLGIILRGAGKAFVAGADLKFFKDNLDDGNVDRIIAFTQDGQALFQRIDACPKQVVVLLDGLSLGGGSELALCGDTIIATDRGSMGFPETGLGIYPGLGGTQRASRRAGVAAAQWLVLSGQVIGASQALKFGLVDALVSREDAESAAHSAALSRPKAGGPDPSDPQVQWIQAQFAADRISGWLDGSYRDDSDPAVAKLAKKLSFKAPVAMRIAAELVALSGRVSTEDGIQAELDRLPDVFGTKDAYEGICSVLERRRPGFTGS
jgi:enoyl-CoA hydratase/3-hydroxyacyl-CoA dehydrogenase